MKWIQEKKFKKCGDWWRLDIENLSIYVKENFDQKWIANIIDFNISASVTETADSSEEAVTRCLESLKNGVVHLDTLVRVTQSVLKDGISFEEAMRQMQE